jgi:hypothetical protein
VEFPSPSSMTGTRFNVVMVTHSSGVAARRAAGKIVIP